MLKFKHLFPSPICIKKNENENQIRKNARARRSPTVDLNWQNQSDLHTQLTNQAWLGKRKSGFWKEKEKGANCKRRKRKERNLATFADHHCIEGYNSIESDVIQKILFRWIWKVKLKRRAWSNNRNHGDKKKKKNCLDLLKLLLVLIIGSAHCETKTPFLRLQLRSVWVFLFSFSFFLLLINYFHNRCRKINPKKKKSRSRVRNMGHSIRY